MTARERIRAAECGGCRKMFEQAETNAEYLFHPPGECTAPTDDAIIERLARDLDRLLFSLGCQLAGVEGALAVIEAKNSAIAGIERIAAALSLSPEAGVEEIVERAKGVADATNRLRGIQCCDPVIDGRIGAVIDAVRRQAE